MNTLPPSISPSPMTKKRKTVREVNETTANGNQDNKFLRSRFGSFVYLTEDESDGLDDSEFQAEHEKYLKDAEKRTQVLLEAEKRRQLSVRCRIEDNVVGRLEAGMKHSREKAYGRHYQAARSKVIREEARRKREAREIEMNQNRHLLPMVIIRTPPPQNAKNVLEKVGQRGRQS
jgi:hypothetical protein